MATLLEIYNLALGNLGIQQTIDDTSENTNEAVACNRFYTQALDSVLSEFPWPFATKWSKLPIINTLPLTFPPVPFKPISDWQYMYSYPSDCVAIRNLVPMLGGSAGNPIAGYGHLTREPYTIGQEQFNQLAVTVNQHIAQADPTPVSPVVFSVAFNRPITVATFTATSVVLSGTAGGMVVASIVQTAPFDATRFDVAVTVTSAGTVSANIPQGVVSAGDGATNQASTSTDNTITFAAPTGFALSGRYTLDPGTAPIGQLFATITETISGQVINAPGTTVLNTFINFAFPNLIAAGAAINVTFVVTPGGAFTEFPYATPYPATMPAANTTRDFSLQR